MIGLPLLVLGLLLGLTALVGERVREQRRGVVGTFLLSPIHPASWAATGALLLGSWVELAAVIVFTSLVSMGGSLLVLGVGVVLFGLAIEACRVVARIERWRATLADPRPLRPHAYRPYGKGVGELLLAVFTDPRRWRDVIYVLVAAPLAFLEVTVAVALWVTALALISVPAWLPGAELPPGTVVGFPGFATPAVSREVVSLVAVVVGVLLLPVAASASRGLMALHRAVVEGLLCESERQSLVRRVETLETSRRAVLDVEASELRRIERDLHDGAQQRLVMLQMDLGMADDKLDTDPAAARALIGDAREHARLALAELRDLVRGIAPAILLDRGLVPALAAIAGRCPVPTTVSSTLPDGSRLPEAVERAAYFVVTEALANVAKHASASRCEIRCRRERDTLVVEVWDDGTGGAVIAPGGGLGGLAGRVEALDGALTVDSPSGGPTLVRAEIPVPTPMPPPPPGVPDQVPR